jgi:hypothetical protein
MSRLTIRMMLSLCLLALLSCASCTTTKPTTSANAYTRSELLQVTQLGTKRINGKPKIEKQKRILVQLRGNENASYYVLTGPIKHGSALRIKSPPTKETEPGKTPPDVTTDSVALTETDDEETATSVTTVFPFFNLMTGYAYASGIAPAAQTEHVIAGSDSTKFIVEVDPNGMPTNPDAWIHRVYVLEGTVNVQARDGGVALGSPLSVTATRYVEVRHDTGSWAVYGPSIYGTGPNDFVTKVLNEVSQANVP